MTEVWAWEFLKCVTLCKVSIFFKTGHVLSNKQRLNKKDSRYETTWKLPFNTLFQTIQKERNYVFMSYECFQSLSLYGKITGKRDEGSHN